MSASDLRTRIAAALQSADDDYAIDQTNAYLNLADAVIRELGLWKQLSNWHPGHYRHVTDWKADDE